jgi:hypothetical protein
VAGKIVSAGGLGDGGGRERAASAAAIVDDEGLADLLRHLIEHRVADEIDGAAGGDRHRDADRLARPSLCLCLCLDNARCGQEERQSGEEGAAHGQAQLGVVSPGGPRIRDKHNAYSPRRVQV